jgi:hypothetical protein
MFKDDNNLVSFTSKKKKTVMLLSTTNVDTAVRKKKWKTEIINLYNSKKLDADKFDEIVHSYTGGNFEDWKFSLVAPFERYKNKTNCCRNQCVLNRSRICVFIALAVVEPLLWISQDILERHDV